MLEWIRSPAGYISAGCCVVVTVAACAYMIARHLNHYHEPALQRYAIRIILMVPVYSIDSYISLWIPEIAFYVNSLRDLYEAYVIYNFLAMCLEFVGGAASLVGKWEADNRRVPKSYLAMTCCLGSVTLDGIFLRRCIQGVLQYVIVRILATVVSFITELAGCYDEGSLSPKTAYLYIMIIMNVSVIIALYSLLVFAMASKPYLKGFQPVLKFTALKLIIFVTYWQYIAFSILFGTGLIKPSEGLTRAETVTDLQDWLMCIECVGFAGLMFVAYPVRLLLEFPADGEKGGGEGNGKNRLGAIKSKTTFAQSFRHAINVRDVLDDTRTYTDNQYRDFVSLGRDNDIEEAEADAELTQVPPSPQSPPERASGVDEAKGEGGTSAASGGDRPL